MYTPSCDKLVEKNFVDIENSCLMQLLNIILVVINNYLSNLLTIL